MHFEYIALSRIAFQICHLTTERLHHLCGIDIFWRRWRRSYSGRRGLCTPRLCVFVFRIHQHTIQRRDRCLGVMQWREWMWIGHLLRYVEILSIHHVNILEDMQKNLTHFKSARPFELIVLLCLLHLFARSLPSSPAGAHTFCAHFRARPTYGLHIVAFSLLRATPQAS